jgi:hypothetical protein
VCVPEEWPPGELEDGLAEEGAHPDHEEDVEDGRAHDSPDPHICLKKMHSNKSLQMKFKKHLSIISRSTTHTAFMMQLCISALVMATLAKRKRTKASIMVFSSISKRSEQLQQ